MTKVREPSSVPDAVTRIAGRIGWGAMADAVGKTERAVRNWSDPDMDRSPSMADALALDAAYLEAGGGDPPILAVYQVLLARRVQPPADSADLARATANAAREAGEAVAAAVQAAQPCASAADRALAVRELDEAIDEMTSLRRQIGAPQ